MSKMKKRKTGFQRTFNLSHLNIPMSRNDSLKISNIHSKESKFPIFGGIERLNPCGGVHPFAKRTIFEYEKLRYFILIVAYIVAYI